jgi:heme exporter protein D
MQWDVLVDRLLGFMPQRSVFWSALGTFFLSLTIQYVHQWLQHVTALPWMEEKNQRERQKILQDTYKMPTEKK